MKPPIVILDRVWVKTDLVDMEHVNTLFTQEMYDEINCSHCEFLEYRPCDTCAECPAYEGTYSFYKTKGEYVGLPIGARAKLKQVVNFKKYGIVDKRSTPPLNKKIEFTGILRQEQVPAVDAMVEAGYGILKAPPRAGKTVLGIAIAVRLGYKTLILANQYDFLEQFYETLCGSQTQKALTNIPDIEKFTGKKLCGIAKCIEDYSTYDICLSTYQTFISEIGAKRLDIVKSLFGTVIVDECHKGNAMAFSKVISQLRSRHRFGLTGTVERKDGKEFMIDHLIGPVKYHMDTKRLVPIVEFVESGFTKEYMMWVYALRGLERDKARNKLIVDEVFKRLQEGHSIVIPVAFTSHIHTLVKMINRRAGRIVAVPFYGKVTQAKRREFILGCRSGKFRVLVGIRQMIQLGINVPRWSCLLEVMPISNPPNHEQETSRILTPMEGKKRPLIVYFIDNMGIAKGCLRTCVFKTHKRLGHYISREQWSIIGPYLKRTSGYIEGSPPEQKKTKSNIGVRRLIFDDGGKKF